MESSTSGLRAKKSMPDMKTLHTTAPRLNTRLSNGNMREGYATIGASTRRSPGVFGSPFPGANVFNSTSIPPVPTLPLGMNGGSGGGGASDGPNSGVVRQPRGPSTVGGFGVRRERVNTSEAAASRGLEATSHIPLEI